MGVCTENTCYYRIKISSTFPLFPYLSLWSRTSFSQTHTPRIRIFIRSFIQTRILCISRSRIIIYNLFFFHKILSSPFFSSYLCEMPAKLELHVKGSTQGSITSHLFFTFYFIPLFFPCFWHNQRQFGTVCIYIHICIYIYNIYIYII